VVRIPDRASCTTEFLAQEGPIKQSVRVLILRVTDPAVAIREADVVPIQYPLLEFAAAGRATVITGLPAAIEVSGSHIAGPEDIPPAVLERIEGIVGCTVTVELVPD
jgi:hypothetical protein